MFTLLCGSYMTISIFNFMMIIIVIIIIIELVIKLVLFSDDARTVSCSWAASPCPYKNNEFPRDCGDALVCAAAELAERARGHGSRGAKARFTSSPRRRDFVMAERAPRMVRTPAVSNRRGGLRLISRDTLGR